MDAGRTERTYTQQKYGGGNGRKYDNRVGRMEQVIKLLRTAFNERSACQHKGVKERLVQEKIASREKQ